MSKDRKTGTFIHGIAASEMLDSSGERIVIDGVDISSLTVDGVLNWEHKNENASQIVGKILQAKKIMKEEDCETEAHKYFWKKVKCPYLYVAGELFDHVGHGSAEDVAAMLKYDKGLNKDETKALINFSIEGSTLKKEGSTIKKCIARKVTITLTPCNKTAFAEQMDEPKDEKDTMGGVKSAKEILDNFKKSEEVEVEVLQKAAGKYMTQLAGAKGVKQPKSSTRDYVGIGPTHGEQRPGKEVKPKREFSQTNAPDKMQVGDRIKHTSQKPKTGHSIYNDPDTWKAEDKDKVEQMKLDLKKKKKKKLGKYDSNVRKALVAGSGMGAPGAKTGGEALQSEDISKKKVNVYKSLSNGAWDRLEKKEELLNIIKKRSPEITEKEAIAIAKTMAYVMEKKEEMKLQGLNPNFDVKENFKTPTSGSADAKVPKEEPQNKEPKESKEGLEKKQSVNLKSKHKSKKGGLTAAGRKKYNKETGGNLKAPVTEKNPKGKKKKRKKSFCARMSGNKGPLYEYKDTDRDGDKEKVKTRKKKALDRWRC